MALVINNNKLSATGVPDSGQGAMISSQNGRIFRGLFQRKFTFQPYSPKDCRLSSRCSLELSNGISTVFSNGLVLFDTWCGLLP